MDGIHDMGGMQGFRPVAPRRDEPPFHEPWEGRMHGIALTLWATDLDLSLRPQIERIETVHYLTTPYYQHWQEAFEQGLVDLGTLTRDELDVWVERLRAGERPPGRRDQTTVELVRAMFDPIDHAPPAGDSHRFTVGRPVRVRRISTTIHNRCPRYVRGARGVVERLLAPARAPENEDDGGDRVEPCYTVAFRATELWPDDDGTHTVLVDLWESYLDEEDRA